MGRGLQGVGLTGRTVTECLTDNSRYGLQVLENVVCFPSMKWKDILDYWLLLNKSLHIGCIELCTCRVH